MILNGRKVIDVEVDGVDTRDYPDFCDAYFSSARFEDNGAYLNEVELDKLMDDYAEDLWQMAYEHYM